MQLPNVTSCLTTLTCRAPRGRRVNARGSVGKLQCNYDTGRNRLLHEAPRPLHVKQPGTARVTAPTRRRRRHRHTRPPSTPFTWQIHDWAELDKLASLPALADLVLAGNPIYDGIDKATARLRVLKRLPRLEKVDNSVITDVHREAAAKLP